MELQLLTFDYTLDTEPQGMDDKEHDLLRDIENSESHYSRGVDDHEAERQYYEVDDNESSIIAT